MIIPSCLNFEVVFTKSLTCLCLYQIREIRKIFVILRHHYKAFDWALQTLEITLHTWNIIVRWLEVFFWAHLDALRKSLSKLIFLKMWKFPFSKVKTFAQKVNFLARKIFLTCPTPPQRLFLNSLDSGDTFTYPQSVHWTRRTASRGALQKWTNEDLYDILKGKTVVILNEIR